MYKQFFLSTALVLSLSACGGTPSLVGTWTKAPAAGTTGNGTLTFAGSDTSGTLTVSGTTTTTATGCALTAMGTGTWMWPAGGSLTVTFTSASAAQASCMDATQNFAQMTLPQSGIDALNASISGTVTVTATTLTIVSSSGTETYTRQ